MKSCSIVICLVVIILNYSSAAVKLANTSEQETCSSINEDADLGFEISCHNSNKTLVGNCTSPVPIGTTAIFKCRKFYTAPTVGSSSTSRTCLENGEWSILRPSFQCRLNCGIGGNMISLITGDVSSKKGKWPWHAALFHEDPPSSKKWELKCSGSLITPDSILTAAHCVTKRLGKDALPLQAVYVGLGKYYRSFNHSEEAQLRRVSKIEVHEEYSPRSLDNNIAIIFLDQLATITELVRPVCLPNEDTADDVQTDSIGNFAGWGRSSGGFKAELQEARFPIVDSDVCRMAHPTLTALVRSGTATFCAGYRNGTSACDGDGGGGLVMLDSGTKRRYYLQGILSGGVGKRTGGCDERYYSVYTRVSKYTDWIESKLDGFPESEGVIKY